MHNFHIAGLSFNVCHDCASLEVKEDENGKRTFTISIKETYEQEHLVKGLDDVRYEDDLMYLGYKYLGHLPESGINKYSETDSDGYWIYERLFGWEKDGEVVISKDIGNTNCYIVCVLSVEEFNKGVDVYDYCRAQGMKPTLF